MGHTGAIASRIYEKTMPEIGEWRGQISVGLWKQVCKASLNVWDEINHIKVLCMGVAPLTWEGFQHTESDQLGINP